MKGMNSMTQIWVYDVDAERINKEADKYGLSTAEIVEDLVLFLYDDDDEGGE